MEVGRCGRTKGVGGLSTADVWTSPKAWAANSAGEVTAVQWALIAGRRVWPPIVAWAVLLGWGALVIGVGIAVDASRRQYVGLPEEQRPGALEMMVTVGVIFGLHAVPLAVWAGQSRWRARRRRRGRIAALRAGRIAVALGEIGASARVGETCVLLPDGAPPLPPPGAYRLYWLEPARRGGKPLLLSAEPVDTEETANRTHRRESDEDGPTDRRA